MAKKKYYAVRAGRTPGIYTSWDACKAQVDGFANASFKSFPTKEEAEAFLGNNTKENKIEDDSNRELGAMGQNYLRSLFAVGFQGMLILVCVAIYAVLIQGIATGGDPIGAIWGCIGYTVLLCFMLLKTGTISKSIFSAH